MTAGDVNVAQMLLREDELYLIHEALGEFVHTLPDTPREAEVEDVLNLRERIGFRIDDIEIAAGRDPR